MHNEHLHPHHLRHQEQEVIFCHSEDCQEDSANPAALPANNPEAGASETPHPSSLPLAPGACPSSAATPTSSPGELKEEKENEIKVRKKEQTEGSKKTGRKSSGSKMTGREDLPRHLCQQGIREICKLEENLSSTANYLLDPESGAWLEPPGPSPPSSSSSGLSGTSSGHHCQPGMTRGKGVQEFLSGGRDSSNMDNGILYSYFCQPDCRATFSNIVKEKTIRTVELGQANQWERRTLTNLRESTPLDDAANLHHLQLITSPTSDTGVLDSFQSS